MKEESITDLLIKQAKFVREKSDLLKSAEKLQQAAAELIKKANAAPTIHPMKLAQAQKKKNFETFVAGMANSAIKDVDENLKAQNFSLYRTESITGKRIYFNKDLPQHKVIYHKGKFTITYKDDVQTIGLATKNGFDGKFVSIAKYCKTPVK